MQSHYSQTDCDDNTLVNENNKKSKCESVLQHVELNSSKKDTLMRATHI